MICYIYIYIYREFSVNFLLVPQGICWSGRRGPFQPIDCCVGSAVRWSDPPTRARWPKMPWSIARKTHRERWEFSLVFLFIFSALEFHCDFHLFFQKLSAALLHRVLDGGNTQTQFFEKIFNCKLIKSQFFYFLIIIFFCENLKIVPRTWIYFEFCHKNYYYYYFSILFSKNQNKFEFHFSAGMSKHTAQWACVVVARCRPRIFVCLEMIDHTQNHKI
jgi:hypothetical protein